MNTRAAAGSAGRRGGSGQDGPLPLEAALSGRRSSSWWGMLLLLVTDAVLFAALLASYFYLRSNSVLWPPQGVDRPELTLSSINTALLILSSLAMLRGVAGVRRGAVGWLRAALGLAFVLGAVFLGLQVYAFTRLPFAPQDHAYGSIFWTLTVLHAAHVLVGLLMNLYVQLRAGYGHFGAERTQAVDNLALYWHFVVVVWLFIFVSLFLSPYW
jgi:heme/copper-type cytochrome/quinol oxidase subunit 3